MANTRWNGRLIPKHDIASNWEKATNFVPYQGEFIIYDADENNSRPRTKIGDGVTNVNDLPFSDVCVSSTATMLAETSLTMHQVAEFTNVSEDTITLKPNTPYTVTLDGTVYSNVYAKLLHALYNGPVYRLSSLDNYFYIDIVNWHIVDAYILDGSKSGSATIALSITDNSDNTVLDIELESYSSNDYSAVFVANTPVNYQQETLDENFTIVCNGTNVYNRIDNNSTYDLVKVALYADAEHTASIGRMEYIKPDDASETQYAQFVLYDPSALSVDPTAAVTLGITYKRHNEIEQPFLAVKENPNIEGRGDNGSLVANNVEKNVAAKNASAFGDRTEAYGDNSFASGTKTVALWNNQMVQGSCNALDLNDEYVHIVGNSFDERTRSNAYALDWDGNAHYAGDVYVQGDGANDFAGAKKLATEESVTNLQAEVTALNEEKVNAVSTAEQESAPLGAELASASGWTTDGWTGSFATGFKHVAGNTNPLIFAMPEATGTTAYQITFTLDPEVNVEAETENGIWVSLGGSEYFDMYGQLNPCSLGIKSVSDGNLQFNVGSSYTGTISNISVKRILGTYNAPTVFKDSDGDAAVEIRPTTASQRNLFLGANSGEMVTSGHANVGIGADALRCNTSGYRNIGIGSYAMEYMTVGSRNAAIGHTALRFIIEGQRNTAIGNCAMTHIKHGHRNIAIGADCMFTPNECSDNVAIGYAAMYADGQGDGNVAIGNSAMYRNTGARNVAIGDHAQYYNAGAGNIAIGYRATYGKKAGDGNVVIGDHANGLGASNATQAGNVVIGHSAGAFLGDNCNSNVIIGREAGNTLTSGSGNIIIGGYIKSPAATTYNWINIGNLYQGSKESGKMYASIRGGLEVTELPTSDPGIAGRFWNDGGTVKVSAG